MNSVLVVDDEKSIRITLKTFLESDGYDVMVAEDSDEALKILKEKDIDVVVTDIILPRVTGIDLLKSIKHISPDVQVIMMTGEPTVESATESLRMMAFDYLYKPVSKNDVLKTVKNAGMVKQLNDENRKYKENLEQLVQERTADLVERQEQLVAEVEERKRAEGALKDSEERLRLSTELANVAVWEYDFISDSMSRSKNHDQLYGIDWQTKWDISTFLNATHPDDREVSNAIIQKSVTAKGPDQYTFDFRVVYPDRSIHWLMVIGQVVERNSEGQGILVRGCLIDITERKQVEEDRKNLLAAIEQVAEGIAITDINGIIAYVNPSMEKITGYSASELIGQSPRILKSNKHDDFFYQQMWETITSGNTWKGQLTNKKKDGTFYTEKTTISPVFDKSGTIINFVAVKQDITDEIKIREILQQSQKMESIGTLAGGIAHDFNNILFPMSGYVEMLMDDMEDQSPFQEYLKRIQTGISRASELVKQILMVSRQANGERSVMRIQPVLKEVIKLSRASIPSTIKIEVFIENDCGFVSADPTQIHQIAMTLITNAYYAIEPGHGTLGIHLKEVNLSYENSSIIDLEPGNFICLTVTDTGVGIDSEILEKIFDPYFTTKKKGKGTGLGLSIVYGIVKACGGNIRVKSIPGEKTEFMVYLPKAEGRCEKPEEKKHLSDLHGTEHILLVDDEKPIILMLERSLQRKGYTVIPVTNSLKALELFRSNPEQFDLVITDMTMPNLTGDQLSKEFKKIRKNIPIIILTGYSETIDEQIANGLNINAFLMKPVDIKVLCFKIRQVLDEISKPMD